LGKNIQLDTPTCLFLDGEHAVYWLGNLEESAFRCNVYLIVDQGVAIIVDPGNRAFFELVKGRVAQIVDPTRVTGMIVCHQDPDVAASMIDWLDLNPEMLVMTSPRTNVLLPHYGRGDYNYYDTSENPRFRLPSGSDLQFIEAPFLHFPGAFTTYDSVSKFLFSGDIWAALDLDWQLVVDDFDAHVPQLDLFHIDYMASNIAARGFVRRLNGVEITAILPQHGSIIDSANVPAALDYLENLQCGVDCIYADL
jgi:flavorubredoxin